MFSGLGYRVWDLCDFFRLVVVVIVIVFIWIFYVVGFNAVIVRGNGVKDLLFLFVDRVVWVLKVVEFYSGLWVSLFFLGNLFC